MKSFLFILALTLSTVALADTYEVTGVFQCWQSFHPNARYYQCREEDRAFDATSCDDAFNQLKTGNNCCHGAYSDYFKGLSCHLKGPH